MLMEVSNDGRGGGRGEEGGCLENHRLGEVVIFVRANFWPPGVGLARPTLARPTGVFGTESREKKRHPVDYIHTPSDDSFRTCWNRRA